VEVFVGVLTAPKNFELRAAQREGWLGSPYFKNKGGKGSYGFFIGGIADEALEAEIQSEMKRYGDIIRTPRLDGYYEITHKLINIMEHGARVANAQYVVKVSNHNACMTLVSHVRLSLNMERMSLFLQ